MDRIFDNDGLITAGPQGDNGDRHFHQISEEAQVIHGWLGEILSPQQIDAFFRGKEFDGSNAFPFVRVRINLLDSLRGPAMVLRLIPQTILTMEQLKLPAILKELAASAAPW